MHVLLLAGLSVLVGIAAGIYPAFLLSGFKPTRALKGEAQVSQGLRLRQGLVVFQFMTSIAILVCTGIVYQQLGFMRSVGLGFNKENVIVVENTEYLDNQLETFKQELNRIPGVQNVSSGYSLPGTLFFTGNWWATTEPKQERQTINFSYVDWDYLGTLDIALAAGRGFSRKTASTDSMAVVLNEAAAREFGWTPREALGKNITMWSAFEYTVIGVMKDFHYESLHREIRPLVFFSPLRQQKHVAVRVEPGNVASVLAGVRSTWEQFSDLTFSYSFLADDLNAQYRSEERLAGVFGNFAILAVIIACLGLFGLAAYASQRRTKEIGIRKVLGATIFNIVRLLSKDFLKLVLLGFLIAVPISWYVMNQWLQDFAYKIDIGLGVFLSAGIAAMFIALVTVSWQSIKAALANPVESLKNE
jgi:putative ABC transport system permease protein